MQSAHLLTSCADPKSFVPQHGDTLRKALALACLMLSALLPQWGTHAASAQEGTTDQGRLVAPGAPDVEPDANVPAVAEPMDRGLWGTLPEFSPDLLSLDEFDKLGESWADWTEETGRALVELYENPELTRDGQQELIGQLAAAARTLRDSARKGNDPEFREIALSLAYRIEKRVRLFEAILATLPATPQGHAAALSAAIAQLGSATRGLASNLRRRPQGEAWIDFFDLPELEAVTPDNLGETRAAVADVADEFARIDESGSEAQQTFIALPPFVRLRSAIDRVLATDDLIETANTPAEDDPEPDHVRNALRTLVEAVEEYEAERTKNSVDDIRAAFAEVQRIAPDGGAALTAWFVPRFRNYNLHMIGTERVLSRFVNDTDTQTSPVNSRSGDVAIYGTATTDTTILFDMKPSPNIVDAMIYLTGTTKSNTAGVTSQATVYAAGTHRFWARKPMRFDGRKASTGVAHLDVDPNLWMYGAKTKFSGWPIIGRIAKNIALKEANKRRGQSERRTADRLKDRVLPELEEQINTAVSEGNSKLDDFYARLRQKNLYPELVHASSTENAFRYVSLVENERELAGDVVPAATPPVGGLVGLMHESLANSALNQFGLSGNRFTRDELADHLREQMESLAPPSEPAPAERIIHGPVMHGPVHQHGPVIYGPSSQTNPLDALGLQFVSLVQDAADAALDSEGEEQESTKETYFLFEEDDPMRVRIDEGKIFLTIRAAFILVDEPENEGDEPEETQVPPRKVTLTIVPRIENGKLILKTTDRAVTKAEGAPAAAAQTRAVDARLEELISQEKEIDATFPVAREGKPDFVFHLTHLTARNGWLTLYVQ